jgi:trimethylamine-N-oxide reductase (cytochrome c)
MGDKVPGMAPNSTLLDIRKYEGEIPDSQLFESKLDKVALEGDPNAESCKEIIQGHGFEAIQAKVKAAYQG